MSAEHSAVGSPAHTHKDLCSSLQHVGGTSRSLFLAASAAPIQDAIGLTSHVINIITRRTYRAIRIITIVAARERRCL